MPGVRFPVKILPLVFPALLAAQNTGSIHGSIYDQQSGEPLVGVNVLIKNTFLGTATDQSGHYTLRGLKAGDYTLVVSMIGYRAATLPAVAVRAAPVRLDIALHQDVLASPQVIVTASRKAQDIMEAPVSVSVIGPRQIRDKAVFSLEKALPYEAGVYIVRDQLNIRGASGFTLGAGSRSLLLLDGVPLLGSAAGNITWAVVPTSEISQVEIVKSGGSALYGSSAMGGVLNIITRHAPAAPETRLRTKLGFYSQPRYRQWAWRDRPGFFSAGELSHARPFGAHSFWVRLQLRQSKGSAELDWTEAANLTGKLKLNFGSRYSATVYANFLADQGGFKSQWKSPADPFEAPLISRHDRSRGTKFNLNGFLNFIYSPAVVMKLRGALYDVRWRNYGTNTDDSHEQKVFGEYQVETNWSPRTSTIAGLALQRAGIKARIFGVHSSLSLAAYLVAQQHLGEILTLTLGGRQESYLVDGNLLDQRFVPQAALNLHPLDNLSLRASAGWGFRVPTVAEMFSRSRVNVFEVKPNPELASETSLSREIGGTLLLPGTGWVSGLKLDAALFETGFAELIEPVPDDTGTIHFRNITRARIRGTEIGLGTGLFHKRVTLTCAYTWLDPVELDPAGRTADTLSYRYRHHLVTTAALSWRGLTAGGEYRYASRMDKTELFPENPKTGQDRRVPVHLWNASLGYRLRHLELLVRVENLFQYYYVELERNLGEERNLSLTLDWTF